MNLRCDACDRATQCEPALSGEAVPSGWGMREISGHRFFLCPMCGNAAHFVGGVLGVWCASTALGHVVATSYGITSFAALTYGRMNLDGSTQIGQSGPQQITHGNNEWHPEYTPDGKWLVYVTMPQSLAKIPAAGGTPVRLTNGLSWRPTVSPDSQWIAYNRLDEASGQWQIAVIPVNSGPINGGPIDGGAKPKIFDAPSPSIFRALRWTPDGKSVAYPVTTGNVSNIWSQPLAGGPPRQLTNFKDQLIFDFAWSRDGKHLALSRGIVNSDVVIISNIR